MNVVIPTLKGPNVTLRDIIPSDRASYLANAGQAEANWGFGGPTDQIGPRSEEAADRFLTGRPGWMHWVITVNDRHIGTVSLHDFDESDQHATLALGIMSAKDMGHGYGPEAMNLVLNHGFTELKLHRIDLRVLARNKRAIRSYEKVGFQHEGTLRENALIDGQREDDLIMAILAHEFQS